SIGEANSDLQVIRAGGAGSARAIVVGGSAPAEGRARSPGSVHHLHLTVQIGIPCCVVGFRPLRSESMVGWSHKQTSRRHLGQVCFANGAAVFALDIALLLRIPTSGHVSSTNAPESMLRAKIRSREVGCREATTHSHLDQGALLRRQHELVPGCGAWRVTEPVAKLAC